MWIILVSVLVFEFHSVHSSECSNANTVYDVMIVQTIDGTYPGTTDDMFAPMPSARNTLELRTAAYTFFNENYGLEFDAADDEDQSILNGSVYLALMAISADVPYRINAFDDQTSFQNRMQTTNVIISDVVFMVSVSDYIELPSHSIDHGVDELFAGESLVYGTYRILIDGVYNETVMPDITYHTSYGEVLIMGEAMVLACAVEHEYFGMSGQTVGVSFMHNNDDDTFTVRSRMVMTFPASFSDADYVSVNDGKGCRDLGDDSDESSDSSNVGKGIKNLAFLSFVTYLICNFVI